MGTIIHDHLIITTNDTSINRLMSIQNFLSENFPDISYGPIPSQFNGFMTFGVCTSGSKEGWGDADKHREKLENLKKILDENSVSWVHLTYGDSCDQEARIDDCSYNLKESIDDNDFLD